MKKGPEKAAVSLAGSNANRQGFLRLLIIVSVTVAAIGFRLIPHLPNFTPIAAAALFAGALIERRWLALLVPLTAMIASDAVIGFHDQVFAVYGAILLSTVVGFWLHERRSAVRVGAATLSGSLLFFFITNFSVWAETSWYEKSAAGLIHCYAMALPFLQYSLLGDFFFSAVLFGGWALAERKFQVGARQSL